MRDSYEDNQTTVRHGSTKLPSNRSLLLVAVALAILASLFVAWRPTSEPQPLTARVRRGNLRVTIQEQGLLESSENTEIKCQVRGANTVIWVIESGSMVQPGDLLVRLDPLFLEEQIDERTKFAHWSRSSAERSKATLARAKLAVNEYEEGRYVLALAEAEKTLKEAEVTLRNAENMLSHTRRGLQQGFFNARQLEQREFERDQAARDVEVQQARIRVLEEYTQVEQRTELKGELNAVSATHAANAERAMADASRRDRALKEYEGLEIRAKRAGLVIYPSAAAWMTGPDVAEGAAVHKDQTLLIMPDLDKMQVKLGVHERDIKKLSLGLKANVQTAAGRVQGEVSKVASVTRPAGWWTGNEVRYDTFVKLPKAAGVHPGMSAEVEIVVAEHHDVLKIPVAAIVHEDEDTYCWVMEPDKVTRRKIIVGDTNGIETVVRQGLAEGDEVVLNAGSFQDSSGNTPRTEDAADNAEDS